MVASYRRFRQIESVKSIIERKIIELSKDIELQELKINAYIVL